MHLALQMRLRDELARVTATQLRSGPGDVRLPPAPQPGPPLARLLRGEALLVLWPSLLPCPEETHLAWPHRGGGGGGVNRPLWPRDRVAVCAEALLGCSDVASKATVGLWLVPCMALCGGGRGMT